MRKLEVIFPKNEDKEKRIKLSGDFNTISAMQFKEDLISFISTCNSDFIVDIMDSDRMDLTALNALIIAQKEVNKLGYKFFIETKIEHPIFELLHLTKFERHVNLKIAS